MDFESQKVIERITNLTVIILRKKKNKKKKKEERKEKPYNNLSSMALLPCLLEKLLHQSQKSLSKIVILISGFSSSSCDSHISAYGLKTIITIKNQ